MNWSKVYSYCERGGDPAFWGEPLNAISNSAFILAALIAAWQLARAPRSDHAIFEWVLVVLVFAIGVGSFMFHTYATVWSIPFDTVPISLFMLGYLGYALRRFAGAPWIVVIAAVIGFYFSVKYAQSIPCSNELLPMTRAAGKRCFNGTLGYTPAFIALVLVGVALLWRRHAAGPYLIAAALIFLGSMTFRTIDIEVCRATARIGTHFLWHILNAVLLYILLLAAIRHGGSQGGRSGGPPIASSGQSVP